jgi:two-component system, NarL family, invasion response regulator UvrY
MSVISIMMVDDHPVVREGYSRLLERQGGFRVCAQADATAQAYQSYKVHQPDVVIMDLVLQGAGGLEAVRQIRDWDPEARILIFTMHLCAAFALKAFEAGAVGYLTKTSEAGELIKAVAAVANGRRYLSADVARVLAADRLSEAPNPLDELGPRATEIFRMLASGMDTETIARLLNLSHKTVRNHHYAIKAKIGARNDAHLVWQALESGLFDTGLRTAAEDSG